MLAAVRAHRALILGAALAALICSLAVIAVREATFAATAQVLVTPLDGDGPDPRLPLVRASGDPTRVVQTAANLLDSDKAAAATAASMGPGWTRARVDRAVSVEPQGQSDVVAVTARAGDARTAAWLANEFTRASLEARRDGLQPLVAALIASTRSELRAQSDSRSPLAEELARRLVDLEGLADGVDPTLSPSQAAVTPDNPTGPAGALIVLLALIAGLAVGVAGALLLETFGPRRVTDAAEAAALTGLPVLARIPPLSADQTALDAPTGMNREAAAAFQAVQAQLDLLHPVGSSSPLRRGRVILLTSPSAGAATATCAAGLGAVLADAGHGVLLVDLDPNGSARVADRDALPETPRAMRQHRSWHDAVERVPHPPHLSVLNLGDPQALHAGDRETEDMGEILARARAVYDYVLVTAPPLAEPAAALGVVTAVDGVLLAVETGRALVADLEQGLDLLERTGGRPDGLLVTEGRPWPLPRPRLRGRRPIVADEDLTGVHAWRRRSEAVPATQGDEVRR
jgi:Mrp family chromosome partitioning ATPase